MALDQKIRVTFESVDVRSVPDVWGPSRWRFEATVGGTALAPRTAEFDVEGEHAVIDLPDAEWTREVDVGSLDRVQIEFRASTEGADGGRVNLGRVRLTLRYPFSEREEVLTNRHFAVTARVQLSVGGSYTAHAATDVFACRAIRGHPICTTVSGRRVTPRLEFCEVRPTPSDPAMPRRPRNRGRPVRNSRGHRSIAPTDPINLVQNPSVIPILSRADRTATKAARIEYTYYRPNTLNFTDDDPRLEWTQRSLATTSGTVAFVGPPRGLKVQVYGTREGEVLLECKMAGVELATYRALVRPMKNIVCRFNILNGPRGAKPWSTPDLVQEHMNIANIFLRQAGLQLVLDADATVTNGAVATAIPGIFRIDVRWGLTRGVTVGGFPRCSRLNYRPGVMNFAYIHSDAGGFLGMATDIPANTLGSRVADSGTPSTSWKRPSGIWPDSASRTQRMRVFGKKQRRGHPQLFAMYVTNGNGSPRRASAKLTYAGTIAHELGHVLSLRHRVGPGHDGLSFPQNQNLMHHNNPSTLAQDIDIVQARAVLGSPVVT